MIKHNLQNQIPKIIDEALSHSFNSYAEDYNNWLDEINHCELLSEDEAVSIKDTTFPILRYNKYRQLIHRSSDDLWAVRNGAIDAFVVFIENVLDRAKVTIEYAEKLIDLNAGQLSKLISKKSPILDIKDHSLLVKIMDFFNITLYKLAECVKHEESLVPNSNYDSEYIKFEGTADAILRNNPEINDTFEISRPSIPCFFDKLINEINTQDMKHLLP